MGFYGKYILPTLIELAMRNKGAQAERARLGVILFFGGMELASSSHDGDGGRSDRVVQVVTAGISLWNPGMAYVAGLLLHHADRRGLIRLGDS